jgi:hypothetical protein
MSEPTITCPNCKTEIKLNESLAAPLIAATRQQYEQRMAQKDADVARREEAIREQQEVLRQEKDAIDNQVSRRRKGASQRFPRAATGAWSSPALRASADGLEGCRFRVS